MLLHKLLSSIFLLVFVLSNISFTNSLKESTPSPINKNDKIILLAELVKQKKVELNNLVHLFKKINGDTLDITNFSKDIERIERLIENPEVYFQAVLQSDKSEEKLDLMVLFLKGMDKESGKETLKNFMPDSGWAKFYKLIPDSINLAPEPLQIRLVCAKQLNNKDKAGKFNIYQEVCALDEASSALAMSRVLYVHLSGLNVDETTQTLRAVSLIGIALSTRSSLNILDDITNHVFETAEIRQEEVADWLDGNITFEEKAILNKGIYKFGYVGLIEEMFLKNSVVLNDINNNILEGFKNTAGFTYCFHKESECIFTGFSEQEEGEEGWIDVTPEDLPPNPCTNNPACAIE